MEIVNDTIFNKIAIIERCLNRIRGNYQGVIYRDDYDQQDIIVLNLQRACQASIDLAMHICMRDGLGIPQNSGDAFDLLAKVEKISPETAIHLQRMTGFRNIAVHAYQALQMDILENILNDHLVDFELFVQQILKTSLK